VSAGGIAAIQQRIAQLDSRLGLAGTGHDVRPLAPAFERALAEAAGVTAPAVAAGPLPGPALGGALPAGLVAPAGGSGSLAGVPYGDLFTAAGTRHGVDPELLAAVAWAESGYDPRAVSHAGAQGLMQLMPGTAAGLGVKDSFDPEQAVDGAARLLAGHLRQFGSTELALAAYNAGPGAVNRFGGIPPYAETQAYVPKVVQRYQELLRR
jgi:soluble lytic murein transglycosylase-like protein